MVADCSLCIGYDAVNSAARGFTLMTRGGGSSGPGSASWVAAHVLTTLNMVEMTCGEMNLDVQDSTEMYLGRDLHSIHQVFETDGRYDKQRK
jgi:hypothetical protein